MLARIHKNQVLITSFLSVLASLYILTVASSGRLRADPVAPLLLEAMRPFQRAGVFVVSTAREISTRYGDVVRMAAENQRLRERVLELERERDRLLESEATRRRLQTLLGLRDELEVPSIAAAVIANSGSTWFQSLTVDKGSRDGVRKGMAVVTRAGVLGQVVEANPRSAKVLLVTDPHSAVDAVVQRSRARGIVSGALGASAVMKYVKRSEDVQVGDRLVTSGLGGIFPKGLPIGTVQRVERRGYGLFQQVEVQLAADPTHVEEVLILAPPER
jgi:rod shape-determining protein MreC